MTWAKGASSPYGQEFWLYGDADNPSATVEQMNGWWAWVVYGLDGTVEKDGTASTREEACAAVDAVCAG